MLARVSFFYKNLLLGHMTELVNTNILPANHYNFYAFISSINFSNTGLNEALILLARASSNLVSESSI